MLFDIVVCVCFGVFVFVFVSVFAHVILIACYFVCFVIMCLLCAFGFVLLLFMIGACFRCVFGLLLLVFTMLCAFVWLYFVCLLQRTNVLNLVAIESSKTCCLFISCVCFAVVSFVFGFRFFFVSFNVLYFVCVSLFVFLFCCFVVRVCGAVALLLLFSMWVSEPSFFFKKKNMFCVCCVCFCLLFWFLLFLL